MPENIQSHVRLFADDTAVYLAVGKQYNPQQLQDDLDQLQKWEKLWDMEFNPSKCVVMHITRARHPIKSQYTMHNETLDTVDTARYLEVDISGNLSFNQHVTSAEKFFGPDPAEDRTRDPPYKNPTLYRIAIKAGLYRKAVQVFIYIYPVTFSLSTLNFVLEFLGVRESLEMRLNEV